jgi:hypothetical protein
MTLMKLAVSPVAGLASFFIKGSVAIEIKVIEPR